MQEQTLKERLKSAIQIFQETKDPRAAEVIEHLNKILSTSKARKNLLQYAKHMYPGYKDPAHIQLIAKHLEQLEEGSIKRLAVFMPPRHGKSKTFQSSPDSFKMYPAKSSWCQRV